MEHFEESELQGARVEADGIIFNEQHVEGKIDVVDGEISAIGTTVGVAGNPATAAERAQAEDTEPVFESDSLDG
ncbi:hypothetical protein, partial [Vibrio vulnificus]|uniref:hypothetical protein n=1 Tax=Vibrio vulnificus TaxID=672 RepID=UPI00057E652A